MRTMLLGWAVGALAVLALAPAAQAQSRRPLGGPYGATPYGPLFAPPITAVVRPGPQIIGAFNVSVNLRVFGGGPVVVGQASFVGGQGGRAGPPSVSGPLSVNRPGPPGVSGPPSVSRGLLRVGVEIILGGAAGASRP